VGGRTTAWVPTRQHWLSRREAMETLAAGVMNVARVQWLGAPAKRKRNGPRWQLIKYWL
jgi:hypothetical protein